MNSLDSDVVIGDLYIRIHSRFASEVEHNKRYTLFFHNEVSFSELLKKYEIKLFFSHQEIGNKVTLIEILAMCDFFQRKQYQLERITKQ
jgi:hypothetical protein